MDTYLIRWWYVRKWVYLYLLLYLCEYFAMLPVILPTCILVCTEKTSRVCYWCRLLISSSMYIIGSIHIPHNVNEWLASPKWKLETIWSSHTVTCKHIGELVLTYPSSCNTPHISSCYIQSIKWPLIRHWYSKDLAWIWWSSRIDNNMSTCWSAITFPQKLIFQRNSWIRYAKFNVRLDLHSLKRLFTLGRYRS